MGRWFYIDNNGNYFIGLIPVGIVVDKKIEAYLKIKENLKFKLVELRKSEVGGYTHENCNH